MAGGDVTRHRKLHDLEAHAAALSKRVSARSRSGRACISLFLRTRPFSTCARPRTRRVCGILICGILAYLQATSRRLSDADESAAGPCASS